jgi:hypothetical protein
MFVNKPSEPFQHDIDRVTLLSRLAGLEEGDPAVAHIHFYGRDVDESGVPYAASIPVSKALSAAGECGSA